jgi:hypothetical protein
METSKAILFTKKTSEGIYTAWIPKKCTKEVEGKIKIASWFLPKAKWRLKECFHLPKYRSNVTEETKKGFYFDCSLCGKRGWDE